MLPHKMIPWLSIYCRLSSHHVNFLYLERALKFCPKPGEPDLSLYQANLDRFHLRLKRYVHFLKSKKPSTIGHHLDDSELDSSISLLVTHDRNNDELVRHQKFKNLSDWVPPLYVPLKYFASSNDMDLCKCSVPRTKHNNLSLGERSALKELAYNPNILIKPADKGGAVVVLDREYFIFEGLRQLSDCKFYLEVDTDLTSRHHKDIVHILDEMFTRKEIDITCHTYLVSGNIRTAQFYMLPKIHNNRSKSPGRPIVSGNDCPTERISSFIDFFLQPAVKDIRLYIKDTTHFLQTLNSLGNLPINCILATLDVASLYTNIPNIEGM